MTQQELYRNLINAVKCNDSGSSGDSQIIVDAINQLELTISSQLRTDWEKTTFCENGIVTGYVIKVRDEETGVFTTEYWDALQNPTAIPPVGSECINAGSDNCASNTPQGVLTNWG